MASRSGAHGRGGEISKWEWVAAAIGAVLASGTIGVMFHEALTGGDAPAIVEITVDSVIPAPSGYLVRFTAYNRGDATAASLEIEGELTDGSRVVQTSSATIDFLPSGGSRTATLYFGHDPRALTLRIRPVGHDDP